MNISICQYYYYYYYFILILFLFIGDIPSVKTTDSLSPEDKSPTSNTGSVMHSIIGHG